MHHVEIWAIIPFALMLLSIAILPLIAEKWWENNNHKLLVAILLAIPASIYLIYNGMGHNLSHQMLHDYLPFIIMLGALFVVTGGIQILGDIQARPINNTKILAAGFLLASFIGTTGASMLLIHPLLRINQQRQYRCHTVLFFIALVANCGGILSPLGDPPLFLLYLRGAEFTWFFSMFFEWLTVGVALLTLYYLLDRFYYFKKESTAAIISDVREQTHISVKGKLNIILLLGIVLSVLYITPANIPQMNEESAPIYIKFLREITLLTIAAISWLATNKNIHKANHFEWAPIIEVAYIFIGIFVTMTPALLFLSQNAARLGVTEPWQFYYASGALSAFLDNSPTAVAFHTVAQALPIAEGATVVAGVNELLLKAISLGAVFFGAMTYIGNGPNFMVKAIAEHEGVKMPSFFGYMIKFSLIVLLPIYIIVQLVFV